MSKGPSTRMIHGKRETTHRPVTFPIYQTAAFAVESNEAYQRLNEYGTDEYFYTRYANPSWRSVEEKLAQLEHTDEALLFSSGMAAIATVLLTLLQNGDTIAAARTLYGGTFQLIRDYLPRSGIQVVLLDEEDLYRVHEVVPQAKVVYFESPVNPRTDCLSIQKVVDSARKIGARVVKDNTFASPINQTPIDFGVDVVIHSATKYLGGHSDITIGAVAGPREQILPIYAARRIFGGIPSPHDAFLLDRSLKTLEIRMEQHNRSALSLARFFEDEPKVKRVYYPGLESAPTYKIAQEQMRAYGGMLCIALEDLDSARRFCEQLSLALNVPHLGSAETMVSIPALTSHSMLNDDELAQVGLTRGMVRISVGLENTDDLLEDFRQALMTV